MHATHLEVIIFRTVVESRCPRIFPIPNLVIGGHPLFHLVLTVGIFALRLAIRFILGKWTTPAMRRFRFVVLFRRWVCDER